MKIKLNWFDTLAHNGRKKIALDLFGNELACFYYDANSRSDFWERRFAKYKEEVEAEYARKLAPFICMGLEAALAIAETYASEEVEQEARTRFVHGQVVAARRIRDEIQALIDQQTTGGVTGG